MNKTKLCIPANRLKFYKKLLKVVCEDPSVEMGYCNYLSMVYRMVFRDTLSLEASINARMENLPELTQYRPFGKHDNEYWFPCTTKGWEKRISILEKIIRDMEKGLHIK